MRQMHHWACDIFVGSIVVHMARVFFTGAFRKPRELNWIDRLDAADPRDRATASSATRCPTTSSRAPASASRTRSCSRCPFVGTYLAFWVFGGNFPGTAIIPRFFILHVLIVPLDHHRARERAPLLAGAPEAHAVPRQGSHREERRGLADVPGLHGQDDRLPVHRRAASPRCSAPSPRSTRSGSSARTTRRASPTPSSPTGTWASSTARCASCRRGRS